MNRELLAAAAPKWIEIQHLPAQAKHSMLALWIGAVIDAIEADHEEPDTWEALYLSYALRALTQGAFYGALTFSQMVLIEPSAHRPPRLQADGPEPVKLADLRRAAELLALRKP